MSEEEIKSLITSFREAVSSSDVEKVLSLFADDATFIRPEGTFKGKEEIKRSFIWLLGHYSKFTLTEIDLIVTVDKAALEFLAENTTTDGMKQHSLGMLAFHFRKGKIWQVHDYYDRLLVAQQLAKEWLDKRILGYVVSRMEEGLR
mgnify:CR=1 FL=1